ncbi:MAG: TatD family hydrolase [Verrucomicrobia bacterium]|nr:TatD family hydrolase [Verrucomicrobiota bacterium]
MIDAHNHLHDTVAFAPVETVLQRAMEAGVRRMICNAARESDWQTVLQLADCYPLSITPALGIHPWYVAETVDGWQNRLAKLLREHPGSIIGETGLDLYHQPLNESLQEECFRAHLQMGYELRRPVVIHCVRAWDWMTRILKETPHLPPSLLFHAYSGGKELLPKLIQYGGWFSFAGTLLYEKNIRARQALPLVPKNRLLLETDSPDLAAPPQYRSGHLKDADGKDKSEPADLRKILSGASQLLGMETAALEAQLESNFSTFLAQ